MKLMVMAILMTAILLLFVLVSCPLPYDELEDALTDVLAGSGTSGTITGNLANYQIVIKISAYDNDDNAASDKGTDFSVVVTDPNNGDMTVDLLDVVVTSSNYTANLINDGFGNWYGVQSGAYSQTYSISINAGAEGAAVNLSSTGPARHTITSPTVSSIWTVGQDAVITWSPADVENIELKLAEQSYENIILNLTGTYTIPGSNIITPADSIERLRLKRKSTYQITGAAAGSEIRTSYRTGIDGFTVQP